MRLYALENIAEPGFMPAEKLVKKDEQYFSKVTTGITRRYLAEGASKFFSDVVRLWNTVSVPAGVKYAMDEEGIQYRITDERPVYDTDSLELTLERLEDYYNVAAET